MRDEWLNTRRWTIADNDPPLAGTGVRILCDGEAVAHVRAFDRDEGWVEALCTDGHTGWPGRPHLDPDDPEDVCTMRLYGSVELRMAEAV